VHILVATDADWVIDELRAALDEPGTTFTVCRNGRLVAETVSRKTPDLAILDLQIGSMGGMAVTMALRLDESSGRLPHVPILMLLDRAADIHLAKRSAADGWLIKPLDALRVARAARVVAAGGRITEGLPVPPTPDAPASDEGAESPTGETVATG